MPVEFGRVLLFVAILCGLTTKAQALDFPTRVVRIIVPYAPGGSAGAQARTLAEELSKIWKQQVIVEDKPGGGHHHWRCLRGKCAA
jgi:tripartite-type tricarboxylate transporter receptor subunit TctC